MMKFILLFVTFLIVVQSVAASENIRFDVGELEGVDDIVKQISWNIDFIYQHFDAYLTAYLKDQHESVAVPSRAFAECMYPNHSIALKETILTLAKAYLTNTSLDERKHLCQPPRDAIILDLYYCSQAGGENYTEMSDLLTTITYLPFYLHCTYIDLDYVYNAFERAATKAKIVKKYEGAMEYLMKITKGEVNATKEDECLPMELAKVVKLALIETAAADTSSSSSEGHPLMFLDSFQELIRIGLIMAAKLPILSYSTCAGVVDATSYIPSIHDTDATSTTKFLSFSTTTTMLPRIFKKD